MLDGNKMSQPPKYKTEKYHKYTQNYFGQNSHSVCPDSFVSYREGPEEQRMFGGQIFINENTVLMLFASAKAFSFFGGFINPYGMAAITQFQIASASESYKQINSTPSL